jgi:hypothetical protein
MYLAKTYRLIAISTILITISFNESLHAQCDAHESELLNNYVAENLNKLRSTVFDTYDSDWFELLKYENQISDTIKNKITKLRFDLVEALTCQVQEEIIQKEIIERSKLDIKTNRTDLQYLYPISAGSESFASDIDVGLKGDGTEYGVVLINQKFRELIGEDIEMGALLDINFYAKDFVPKITNELKVDKTNLDKYIESAVWKEYPITDVAIMNADIKFQTEMSLAFMRKSMSNADFKAYSAMGSVPPLVLDQAELEYTNYNKRLNEFSTLSSDMSRSNRAYEKILLEAATKRITYLKSIKENDPNHEQRYLDWKKMMTYCNLHANEAHCTEGAIIHVVVNKQILNQQFKDKRERLKKLQLTEHELYHSFTEQVGFAFSKLDHTHNDVSLVKVGKYMHRAYNALKQFYRATGIDPVYTEDERIASTDWEGLKKGLKRDNDNLFTIKISDEDDLLIELNKLLSVFEKRMLENGIIESMDSDLLSKKNALKKHLIDLKVKVDRQYFDRNKSIYQGTSAFPHCDNIDFERVLLNSIFEYEDYSNAYHKGSFVKISNDNLFWENDAGKVWELKPVYAKGYLDATIGDNPYKTDTDGQQFKLLVNDNCDCYGFQFMKGKYLVQSISTDKIWSQLLSSTFKTKDMKAGGTLKELPKSKNATYMVARWTNDAGESWLGRYNPDTNKFEVNNKHNPYNKERTGKSFDLIFEKGNLKGFTFRDNLYLRQ